MSIRGVTVTGRMAVIFAILFAVAACGGGGGGDDGFIPDSAGGGSGKLTLKLVLLDTEGNETNTVTSAAAGILEVTVNKGKSDIVVTTTTDIGLVFPASGTALTNSNGVATFQIEAGIGRGAGTITSTAQNDDGETFTGTLTFQVGNSGLRLGYFGNDGDFIENEIGIEPGSTLASAGRAQITVAIVDEYTKLAGSSETVRFSSGCLASGQATLSPESPLTSGDGQVSTTYTAAGCAGTDEITASLVGTTGQAFGSVSIAPAEATGLTFVSATPSTIILRGIGGGSSEDRQESSRVIFKVVDRNGTPVQSANVRFALTTEVGGLSLSPASALSGSDGLVGTTVFSGTVPTVVRVIATADDSGSGSEEVATVSDVLTVTTGLPDQNSIDVAVTGGFVVEDGMTISGIERTITVRLADTYNNPVPDGTAALFTTEYGAIQPSCTTTGGSCSVQWNSQDPRAPSLVEGREAVRTIYSSGYNCPSHNGSSGACPDDLGYTRGGRSTIAVTAIGQESFVDGNGNGIMDQDEQDRFDNLPEAFLDNNEDRAYTPALSACVASPKGSAQCLAGFEEQFTDFNSNGEYDLNDDPAVYNGLLCPPEGDGVWCSRELINVRDSTILILSAGNDNWDIILVRGSTVVGGTTEGVTYNAYIADLFNNRPPAGSTVEVSAGGGCEIISETSFDVANSAARGAIGITVETGGDGEAGTLSITLQPTGDGASYTETFNCESFPPPDPNDPGSDGLVTG